MPKYVSRGLLFGGAKYSDPAFWVPLLSQIHLFLFGGFIAGTIAFFLGEKNGK